MSADERVMVRYTVDQLRKTEHVIEAQAIESTLHEAERLRNSITEALEVISRFGGIDGAHHKQWVLDQVVMKLTGEGYEEWVRAHRDGEDGPDSYDWDVGTPP